MSYLALARKWRPTKFNEVVGQSHVLTALENALTQNRLHHAYLFSGTRGVGKTTIGRLLAKGLNCETGITASPCGECGTCKEIDEGRFVDLLEIDAASRTKVEDTRDLLDNVQYKPARGRFKVYLIDEVHMLSRHSFNALLKTLEEPPEYVKFLLATTDPQKLPVTILSRCLQFHLKPISADDIHQQLDDILGKEKISSEARALGLISHAADGSMRDALSLTDQAIALGNGNVETKLVSHMLGTLDTDQAIHLLESISSKQPQQAMAKIQAFAENGVDWDGLLQQLATQLHRLAMFQALPASLDGASPDASKIELLSHALSPQEIQLYYQIALKGREDLALSPTGRIGLEMIVLRMMAFRPASAVTANVISTDSQAITPVATRGTSSEPVVRASHAAQRSIPAASEIASPPSPHPADLATPVSAPSTSDDIPYSSPVTEPVPQERISSQHMSQDIAPAISSDTTSFERLESVSESVQASPNIQVSPNIEETPQPPVTPSAVAGLRHQLRSKRKGLASSDNSKGEDGKKSSAAPTKHSSVLDRVAQKPRGTIPKSQQSDLMVAPESEQPEEKADEPYQWKPINPVEIEQKVELSPSQLKSALDHVKTPEMAIKLIDEAGELDPWSALISRLETSKLVEQLALNSSYQKEALNVTLTLRPAQAHLNSDKARHELLAALNNVLSEANQLQVNIGEVGTSPLELREQLYQKKLQSALLSLENDSNVQFLAKRFSAEIEPDSVRPI